ncbi:MAG: LLM class flavin-dependent oxidoreductase [Rhodospirillaceae bacterium]|jgi:alkanesulfonate monooxygenase SsuD/methylene tetrahydromethanopterin reductase-like flavin-dependent oxidoreductase (luciferase family)|nr:LLM class flavin-dependent oxidoreductase [Rhodospirillaceae bacterium]MBT4042672.1 LLM class flavin-dependent oxidoreductase [Rhodospirillaceae bacterium]MBT4687761.1 LLM class flavin-dependent oxidoreductase [Rhodospirillaceae bacterium]MBT5082815.1 LLM class flavin-dependent oxidoreductase [Rhodospirillaceae bacterium]MBT5524259.1 LLM class flavin-dependent oxidoreductase [Rhodospirillaceae bacterium]
MSDISYGVFDHLDHNSWGQDDLTAFYEDRLRLIEAYDAAGFYAYHLAEHHATPLGTAPSPGIFLSAVAQRSTRLRFGPMVYCLPLYHPIRLLEEICMLDQLSGGRLELGVGRGISPIEVGYFGLDTETAPAMYREALDLILQGMQCQKGGGDLTFAGEHYQVTEMPVTLQPRQQPHPPLWYGLSHPDSTVWAAQNGVNIITNRDEAGSRQITDRYRQEWRNLGHDEATLPRMGMSRHVIIAETEVEAFEIARRAYPVWRRSFYQLWDRHGMKPINVNFPESFDELVTLGQAIAGTPDQVAGEIERQAKASGINYFLCRFAFGDMRYDEAKQSVDLFARHITTI